MTVTRNLFKNANITDKFNIQKNGANTLMKTKQ